MTAKTNITTASKEWATRPADQRFWTLQDLYDQTKLYSDQSYVKEEALNQCAIEAKGGDLKLLGPHGGVARFQHYSFGQFAGICRVPADYARRIPADLAAANLSHGLLQVQGNQNMMFHKNGGLQLRCVTSTSYERIWNYEVAAMALELESRGWRTPPARNPQTDPGECSTTTSRIPTRIATEADVLRKSAHPLLGIKVGDTIAPSGLYASDHDCFIFQVNEDRPIEIDGEVLFRGVIWSNSEVGDKKIRGTMFGYDSVCGNHIIWGARIVAEVAFSHIGEVRQRFEVARKEIEERANQSAEEEVKRLKAAKNTLLGFDKEDVIEMVFKKNVGLGRGECEDAYVMAEKYEADHGRNPHSAWGFASGVTRLSQQQPFADTRDRLDRAAGRILEFAL